MRKKQPGKKNAADFAPYDSPAEKIFHETAKKFNLDLTHHFKFSCYELDFLLQEGDKKIAIEIDGSKWHSSKDALTSDYRRQRFLEMNDFRVIRFTGKEVFTDTEQCVRELVAFKKKILLG